MSDRQEHAQHDGKPPVSEYISVGEDASPNVPRHPGHRSLLLAGLAAALCLVLLVVSVGFIHPTSDGAWSVAWLMSPVQDSEGDSQPEAGSSAGDGSAGSESTAEAAEQGSDSEAAETAESDDGLGTASAEEQGSPASGSAPDTSSSAQSSQGSSSGQGGSSSGGNGQAQNRPSEPQHISVHVSVSSSAVGNPVSASGTVSLNAGQSVYDALCELGVRVNAQNTGFGVYVTAIGGLAEKEHGAESGWVYTVNGNRVNTAASSYKLSDGDSVAWSYVTG